MRYAVTGAAGFIGSHLADALVARGDDVVGIDSFNDYYDPALKEENAAALDVRRLDLARDEIDLAGIDGVFHLAGQPGVRSFGDVFGLYVERNVLASQRLFEAAARDGVRVVFSSSSSVYGEAESYPTPEDAPPAPLSPYGITKLTCEHLVARVCAELRPRRGRAPLLQRLRAAPATGHGVREGRRCARVRLALRPLRRRRADARVDVRRRRRRRHDPRDGVGAAGRTTSAAGWRRRCATRSACSSGSAGDSSTSVSTPPVPGDQRRTNADTTRHPLGARLGAANLARGRLAGSVGMGVG